jgi:hypothetical protein
LERGGKVAQEVMETVPQREVTCQELEALASSDDGVWQRSDTDHTAVAFYGAFPRS